MSIWLTKQRVERDGKPGWLFQVKDEGQLPRDEFLPDTTLQLKLALGGYEAAGIMLAKLWGKEWWFTEKDDNCYVEESDNPLHPASAEDCDD